jgi:hypothetical protein
MACLNGYSQSTSFKLQVLAMPTNHNPVLSGLDSLFPTFSLMDLKNNVYNFGPITDDDSGDTITLTYTVHPLGGNAFFKLDPITAIFKIIDRNGLLKSSVTNYIIKILLKDSNLQIPGNTTYLVTL